ncbi:MAG: tetratricopeptide repeat protein [Gemmatimonadota bacterium]|nr:tetratricopeptide repeat protein [Gemmatimonadota bacterium]
MIRTPFLTALLAAVAACPLGAQVHDHRPQNAPAPGTAVPLYDNLGSYHYPVTTAVPLAQRYFDQGIRLTWAFNHAEAIRAFAEGERLDSTCAMCAWGSAFAAGPNINAPMDSASGVRAYEAVRRALARAARVTPSERALITALAERYGPDPLATRASRDSAYAAAMAQAAGRYPDDVEAQVLHADALMNLRPWAYWQPDGAPAPGTTVLLERLERARALNADHPGACHLYIHAVEARDPSRAVACAERLATLMPGAGHLVHMPGHIYIRVGRYADAIDANKHAVHADESYLEGPMVSRQGLYPQGYYPHNYHFMSFAASMAGASQTAIDAARRTAERLGPDVIRQIPWLEAVTPIVPWTLVTFGHWDDVLREPMPPADLQFATGMAYYARGVALAALGRRDDAQTALDSVRGIAERFPENDNRTALRIAAHALAGELALRGSLPAAAVREFQTAVALEDGLTYNEPPTWYYPMRHSLGKALLAAGQPADAERVYREDLERFPENGWSLFGLVRALKAQGRTAEARRVAQRRAAAWSRADVDLSASRF